MKTRASFVSKRDQAPPPAVHFLTASKGSNYPPGAMLIASPLAIAEIVERIPEGCVLTLPALRAFLASKHGADYTCPLTTGIFLRIAAEAAEQEGDTGRRTPWWRVVREDGKLLDKLPGGPAAQKRRLEEEGVRCKTAGKSWKVAQFAESVWMPG